MPNDKLDKIAPIKEKKFKPVPFMDTYDRQDRNSLVNPAGRVTSVSAPAPKEEPTQSSPSGSLFTPDKSENYSIRDKAPQDR